MTERKITKSDCKYYRESDGNCLNFTYVGEYDPCTDGDLEHCYEKFPHFFNKVERMIAKRFIPIFDGTDKRVVGAKDNGKIISFMDMFDLLNDLSNENEQLKCALALDAVDYIIADGKKIDIPPYYEFEQRYDHVIHRREYDGYD